ncbi:MAG: hypothetical protein K2H45_06575 [Acetatifactor sp.]|nr:hypothetical protein [Acetatifactor sp.]
MKTNNISVFLGDSTQRSRQELTAFSGKKENSNTFFAGAINGKVDPITLKKQMAQKRALKVVGDAFAADRKIDAEVADREARIKQMRAENLEAKKALQELETQKKEIGKEYGLGEEGLSEEDWNILDKGKKWHSTMSDTEKARYQEMEEQGLTEYYDRCKDFDDLAEPYQQTINENTKLIRGYESANEAVHKARLDLRKGNPMIKAQEEAEEIMEAARKEIIGMLVDEGKDHIDEELQEKVEQAQEEKEKKEEEEEKLEAIREDKAQIQNQAEAARERAHENEERAEELIEALPTEELLKMSNGTSDFQQELKDIMNKMKLVAEDLKGAAVDATL